MNKFKEYLEMQIEGCKRTKAPYRDKIIYQLVLDEYKEQLTLNDVVKSLPTEQCVRDWWREGTGDEHFWKHETDWSNEQVFREIYQALTYFINKWQ